MSLERGRGMLYRLLFKLVLQRIPAELTHSLATSSLRLLTTSPRVRAILRKRNLPGDDRLSVRVLGQTFPSPLGASAGLDKNASWFDALGAIGFGFVEIGTLTPEPQEPNPGRIILRATADRSLLNRMGFPNRGAAAAAVRLRRRSGQTVVGINIGKARATPLTDAGADYRASIRAVGELAAYLVINVSSPNTAGLRDMQSTQRLRPLIGQVQDELRALELVVPLLVKISPDLDDEQVDQIADLALETGLDGIVAVNTTVNRTGLTAGGEEFRWFEGGGVSGPPLKARALEILRRLHGRVGSDLVLISVGGVASADDVWERILAGASLVQVYTAFVYGGPGWPGQVNRILAQYVRDAGAASIQELIGSAAAVVAT